MTDLSLNPYRPAPGSDPPALIGRDPELAAIALAAAMTRSGGAAQPIILEGLRGMGKTVLLRRGVAEIRAHGGIVLSAEAGQNFPLGYAFARSLDTAREDLKRLPTKIKDGIGKALDYLHPSFDLPHDGGAISLSPSDQRRSQRSMVQALDEINQLARAHGHFLVIALDEAQEADVDKLRPIITLVHESAGTTKPILFLGAGLPNVSLHLKDVRTYTERWRYFTLNCLTRAQAADAIRIPAEQNNITIEPAAIDALAHASGGYPFFIQEYGAAMWYAHTSKTVSLADAKTIIAGTQRVLDESFYERNLRRLTPNELRYAIAMADLGDGPHPVATIAQSLHNTPQGLSSVRNQLVRKDIAFAPAHGMLEFRMPLTQRYIKDHRLELSRRAFAVQQRVPTHDLSR